LNLRPPGPQRPIIPVNPLFWCHFRPLSDWHLRWVFKRKVGPARQPGSSEGLTRAQAEREFARVREEQSRLARLTRVTMQSAGRQWLARLELKGRKRS
jgi:hypothetical protein